MPVKVGSQNPVVGIKAANDKQEAIVFSESLACYKLGNTSEYPAEAAEFEIK